MKTQKIKSQRTQRRRIHFRYLGAPGARVCLAGDFNQWHPEIKQLEDKLDNGDYRTTLLLAPGDYEYKFVVDGTWQVDSACKDWVRNALGSLNSRIRVSATNGRESVQPDAATASSFKA